jgi:hypothetical protein
VTKRLDAAVTAGKLTKDEETNVLSDLSSRLDDLVNATPGERGFGFGHRGWSGHDKNGGSAPAPADPPAPAPADWSPAPATA